MLPIDDAVLCRYHYDPLDRMAGSLPTGADSVQRFYQRNRLSTEIQGPVRRVVFQTAEQLLAQHESGGAQDTRVLLATDQQRSVLLQVEAAQNIAQVYTAYGFSASLGNLPGFNGEQPDSVTGHYLLGNGYRAFNPVLMRFNSPDSLSPFGKGGLNAYAYCAGDPVNKVDPDGHFPIRALVRVIQAVNRFKKTARSVSLSKNVVMRLKAVEPSRLSVNSTSPPPLRQLALAKFTSNELGVLKNKAGYKALVNRLDYDAGNDNLRAFVSKLSGSWKDRADIAMSGEGKGFLKWRGVDFNRQLGNAEHALGVISHLRPSVRLRQIRIEVSEARRRYDIEISNSIADI